MTEVSNHEINRRKFSLPLIYAPVDCETYRPTYDAQHVLRAADSKLRMAIKANCNQKLLKSIYESALNALHGNIRLSA